MIVRKDNELLNVPSDEAHYYTEVKYPQELKDVHIKDFDFVDNEFVFNLDKYNHRLENNDLELLRIQRNEECFPIINRGQLWYDELTDEQLYSLDVWYKEWLDVTKTKVIPERPSWIK